MLESGLPVGSEHQDALPRTARAPGQGRRVLSFFTGAGGLDLGFEQAGFETVYATDIDNASCATLRLNVGTYLSKDVRVEQADVLTIDPATLPTGIDLVIGGPPCQSFSASGRRAVGAAGRLDNRGRLFEAYCRIIGHVRPKAFVFENVRGILATNKGEDWRAIVAAFRRLGYTLSFRILDALDYGAPQQRERMLLVGHQLPGTFMFPAPTHGPDSGTNVPHVTAGAALAGIQETEELEGLRLSSGKYAHLLPQVPPGQNYLFFTAKRGHERPVFAYRSRFSDFLYKADPAAPVKTIIASPGKYTGPLHWDNRYFSVKEYMRLQGFPDDYRFSGSREDAIRQIGNSVSPLIACRLALAIARQVFDSATDVRLLPATQGLSFDSRKGAKARRTRAVHEAVAAAPRSASAPYFTREGYSARIAPTETAEGTPNVVATPVKDGVSLRVDADDSGIPFASMVLAINQAARSGPGPSALQLRVEGRGLTPATAQAMWNAVDDWVRRSSEFHSLFELYGHFTEPHPMFTVRSFRTHSNHPVALFAAHAADFSNCSR